MDDELRSAIIAKSQAGFSVQMIHRTVAKNLRSAEIHAVLNAVGIDTSRDDPMHRSELAIPSDPEELRARWAKMLPAMKERVRASLVRR